MNLNMNNVYIFNAHFRTYIECLNENPIKHIITKRVCQQIYATYIMYICIILRCIAYEFECEYNQLVQNFKTKQQNSRCKSIYMKFQWLGCRNRIKAEQNGTQLYVLPSGETHPLTK